MKIFADRLREAREEAGESRKDLGDILGVGISQISEMENDRKGTTLERLALICRHYNVSADYMLGLSDRRETL
ncbi:MAG: helix-turn-helix transcriptional regulator [Oscillospiraceae bacterium]|jgi:transcriptional regulator with XRE-family HTH domain|nr:helix-turn-helix transcriptional regulator [Oscillospiraceae bacterium]